MWTYAPAVESDEQATEAEIDEALPDPIPIEAEREVRLTPTEALARMRIHVPLRATRSSAG
jgi:hypothetical protein